MYPGISIILIITILKGGKRGQISQNHGLYKNGKINNNTIVAIRQNIFGKIQLPQNIL